MHLINQPEHLHQNLLPRKYLLSVIYSNHSYTLNFILNFGKKLSNLQILIFSMLVNRSKMPSKHSYTNTNTNDIDNHRIGLACWIVHKLLPFLVFLNLKIQYEFKGQFVIFIT